MGLVIWGFPLRSYLHQLRTNTYQLSDLVSRKLQRSFLQLLLPNTHNAPSNMGL